METLTLQQAYRFTSSSSRRVEETLAPSGLPLQGSIAGCLTSRMQPEEWRATLERLGQEQTRVERALAFIPGSVEASLLEELSIALQQNLWIGGASQPRICVGCVFLTSAPHGCSPAPAWGQAYLIQLRRADPADGEPGRPEEQASQSWERVIPDTDKVYGVQQMAQAWQTIGRAVTEDDVPLSVDPDEYPLF